MIKPNTTRIQLPILVALLLASASAAQVVDASGPPDEAVRRSLEARLTRLESIRAIERVQNAFGYYQDRFLFDQSAALFARGAAVYEDDSVWTGPGALGRWKAHLATLYKSANGPVAGVMLDRPQVQGLIDLNPDGHSAHGRFRTLGRAASYGQSEEWIAGVYENDYVLEDAVWKIRTYRYCSTWTAPYQSGVLQKIEPQQRGGTGAPDRIDPAACGGGELTHSLAMHSLSAAGQPLGAGKSSSVADLSHRAQRLSDVDQIERLHYIYGYQQDKMLWSEQVDLFAEHGAAAIFQNAEYRDKSGVRRLWYGHWSRLTQDTLMQVDGVVNDHFQAQPIITLSEDGLSAQGRFRARDYVFNYATPIISGQASGAGLGDQFTTGGQIRQSGLLALLQDVLYENTFVKEGGVWKIKTFNLCIYASAPYDRGYSDRPIPGHMGAKPDAKPGERRQLDLEEGLPEGGQDLFPANAIGPDRVIGAADSGCYVAKDQVMSRSALFPFHFPNPVTGQAVAWKNQ